MGFGGMEIIENLGNQRDVWAYGQVGSSYCGEQPVREPSSTQAPAAICGSSAGTETWPGSTARISHISLLHSFEIMRRIARMAAFVNLDLVFQDVAKIPAG